MFVALVMTVAMRMTMRFVVTVRMAVIMRTDMVTNYLPHAPAMIRLLLVIMAMSVIVLMRRLFGAIMRMFGVRFRRIERMAELGPHIWLLGSVIRFAPAFAL